MSGALGKIVISAALPVFRTVTAWLEAAALRSTEPPPAPHDARKAALRQRFPDAPAAWIALVAARLVEDEAFELEGGAAGEDNPPDAPVGRTAPTVALPAVQAGPANDVLSVRSATEASRDFETMGPQSPATPTARFAEPHPRAARPAFSLSAEASPAFREHADWQQPRAGTRRGRIGFSVRQQAPAPPPADVEHRMRAAESRSTPRFLAPAVPASRSMMMMEAPVQSRVPVPNEAPSPLSPAERPAPAYKTALNQAATPIPTPSLTAPPVSPPYPAPRWPAIPSALHSTGPIKLLRAVAGLSLGEVWGGTTPVFPTFPAPAPDRWPDLPPSRSEPPGRTAAENERLRCLINDQVERAWNG